MSQQSLFIGVPLSEFGIEGESSKATLPGLASPSADPCLSYFPVNSKHVFSRAMVRDFASFLLNPMGTVFTLVGPHGSGKSSEVRQMAARLNWPIVETTASGSAEVRDWIGGFQLSRQPGESQPTMNWVDGPMVKSMRLGAIFVVNEYDYCRPSELAALNDIIETNRLYIKEINEVVEAHQAFRIVFTGNTNGYEDPTGVYVDSMKQNASLLDRRMIHLKDYLDEASEYKILHGHFGHLPQMSEAVLKGMISVANDVRKSFKAGQLNTTISTRKLVHWGTRTIAFNQAPKPFNYALKHVLLDGIPETDAAAIDKFAQARLGQNYK